MNEGSIPSLPVLRENIRGGDSFPPNPVGHREPQGSFCLSVEPMLSGSNPFSLGATPMRDFSRMTNPEGLPSPFRVKEKEDTLGIRAAQFFFAVQPGTQETANQKDAV